MLEASQEEWGMMEGDRVVQWIVAGGWRRVALQFPDNMLSRSAQMCASLQRVVDSHRGEGEVRLFVLADTAHNPLCVDEVAAAHVEADALVHYGRSDFSPVATLPSLLVFGRHPVDTAAVCRAVKDCVSENGRRGQRTIVIFDQPYLYATEDVCRGVSADEDASVSVVYARPIATELRPGTNNERNGGGNTDCSCADGREAKSSGTTCSRGSSLGASEASKALFAAATVPQGHACVAGYVWPLAGAGSEDAFVWVGDDTTALAQLQLTLHRSRWTRVDPSSGACVDGDSNSLQQTINSRYFLIDKARDANIVGILVGTLGVAGFRDIIGRVRTLAEGAEKKTYTVLVGKPNPAKLANFPEVEVWVMVSSPQGMIFDTREYFCRLITPYEAEIAWGDREWGEYRLDHATLLEEYAGEEATMGKKVDARAIGMSTFDKDDEPDEFPADDSDAAGHQLQGIGISGGEGETPREREGEVGTDPGTALAVQAETALSMKGRGGAVVKSAAEYFYAKRTYWGLEAPSVGAEEKEVVKAVDGLSGRAAGYQGEGGEKEEG